jgi:RNA polymerase sigma-70 factor (ECF subfamily)
LTEQKQPHVDDDLRQRLAAGEYREVFERLVELYSNKVFHLAFSMVRNKTQAEDVTQEALLRIWKGLPGYHGQASFSTWIYSIARNTCLTELKRRAAHPTVSLEDPENESLVSASTALQSVDRETGVEMDVNLLLEHLEDKYSRVLILFYLEQKSYQEVSDLLGLPLGTLKALLFRAKKQLLLLSRRCPLVPYREINETKPHEPPILIEPLLTLKPRFQQT